MWTVNHILVMSSHYLTIYIFPSCNMRSTKSGVTDQHGKKVGLLHDNQQDQVAIYLQGVGVGGGMGKLMSVLHQNAATLVNSKSELNGPDQVSDDGSGGNSDSDDDEYGDGNIDDVV